MVEGAFSFQGRLTRLQFFLRVLALSAAYVLGLGVIALGGFAAAAKHQWTTVGLLVLAVLPLAVAFLWCSLSLHVRRIRDIGWEPTLVVAGWLCLKVADKLILAKLLPALALHDFWHGTYLGLGVDTVLSLIVLFWPGQGREHDDRRGHDADRYLQPGAPRFPEPARVVFGRR